MISTSSILIMLYLYCVSQHEKPDLSVEDFIVPASVPSPNGQNLLGLRCTLCTATDDIASCFAETLEKAEISIQAHSHTI